MLTVEETRDVAERTLADSDIDDVVLHPDFEPIVREWCVVYAYNTRRAIEGDFFSGLAGNGPMVVDRRDGTVRYLPSHDRPEVTLPVLEAELGLPPHVPTTDAQSSTADEGDAETGSA